MNKSVYITKDTPEFIGLDYEKLFKEGLTYIQELAGEQWTDYNTHDPGVTILEQLVVALTEIGYKANSNIVDILSEDNTKSEKLSDTFYRASEILTSSAVTLLDLRKLIIDQVFGVRNIWFEQLNTINNASELKGLYIVYVEASPKCVGEEERIKQEVWNYLDEQSSLCEDIENVFVLAPKEITLNLEIEIEKEESVDEVLADIIFQVSESISNRVRFYTLDELLEEGYDIDSVFNGPLLQHGFIKDTDLTAKKSVLYEAEIIKVIQLVKGISNIKSFSLQGIVEGIEGVIIGKHEIPYLNTDLTKHNLVFTKEHVSYTFDKQRVKRLLNEKNVLSYRTYTLSIGSRNKMEPLTGNALQLKEYYSIQNTFPALYGIGKYGVPSYFLEHEKARAKQLKAYLLFFEQIMANYLAQLGNIKNLYSLDTSEKISYYTQKLTNVPLIDTVLFADDEVTHFNKYNEKVGSVREIKAKTDNYLARKNTILDHLLARFGEQIEQNVYTQFTQYTDLPEEEVLLNAKVALLKKLPLIGKTKAKSFNRKRGYWGNPYNISGLELRIKTLLGIPFENIRLANLANQQNIYLDRYMDEEFYDGPRYAVINDDIINSSFFKVDFTKEEYKNIEEDTENECSPEQIFINKELFQEGYTSSNFRIGKDPTSGDLFYCIVFDNKRAKKWQKVERFFTKEKAICALKRLVDFIKLLNQTSEDFHVVEHILLRPKREDDNISFYLKDESSQIHLKSVELIDFYDFHKQAQGLIDNVLEERIEIEQREENVFCVRINDEYGVRSAESLYKHTTEIAAQKELLSIKEYFTNTSFSDLFVNNRFELYSQPIEDLSIFTPVYDFTISVILPVWSARYSDPEFRKYLESLIIKETPPHIVVNFIWAEREWLQIFEDRFSEWLDMQLENEPDIGAINKMSLEIMLLLSENRHFREHPFFEEIIRYYQFL